MNSSENETCMFNDVADFDDYLPFTFLSVVVLFHIFVVCCRRWIINERQYLTKSPSYINWQTTNVVLIMLIIVLTVVSIATTSYEPNYFVSELIMMITWIVLIIFIFCDLIFEFPRVCQTSCNILHVCLLIIFTISFGRDIYYVVWWYKRCFSTEQRLSFGISVQIRLAITFILWLIQLIYSRRKGPTEAIRLLNGGGNFGRIQKYHRELKVLIPSTSGATSNFFNALQHRLRKDGIRLQRITTEDVDHAEQVIAVCNCCTRIDSDIKQISELESWLQRKILVLIIVYVSKAPYNDDNITYVKEKCENIKYIVEMFFTSELGNKGIKDTPENREALETITKAA